MESNRYLKYKDRYKTIAVLNVASSVCALTAILLFIFVEFFQIKIESLVLFQFSVFTEFKRAVKGFSDMSSPTAYIGIYTVLAFVLLVAAAVYAVVEFAKNLNNLLNPEKFALLQYDRIMRSKDENEKKKSAGSSCFVMYTIAVLFEIICVLIGRFVGKMIQKSIEDGYDVTEALSYYAEANGVSWTLIFCVLFTIGLLALFIISKKLSDDIAYDAVKDEYDGKGQTEAEAAATDSKD